MGACVGGCLGGVKSGRIRVGVGDSRSDAWDRELTRGRVWAIRERGCMCERRSVGGRQPSGGDVGERGHTRTRVYAGA